MPSLRKKVVVITGASSGFGRGAALKFAEHGANLILAARRKDLLKEVAGECKRRGGRAVVVETDVSRRGEVELLAKRAASEFGHIDVWVNDAGVSTFGHYDEVPLNEHEKVIETNLLGTMYGSHAALREFREQGHGTLINIASYLGKGSAPYQAAYVASKHGVRGLGMALRQELEANGEDGRIHVCTIMPTSMDTPFFEHAANHSGHPVVPIPPVYEPEKVIDAIVGVAMNPEDEVIVGRRGKMGSVFGKIAPGFIERKMARKVHRELMEQGSKEGPTTGSLYEPMQEGRGVHGGWLDAEGNVRKPDNRRGHLGTIAAIAGSAAVVGLALARRRQIQQKLAA